MLIPVKTSHPKKSVNIARIRKSSSRPPLPMLHDSITQSRETPRGSTQKEAMNSSKTSPSTTLGGPIETLREADMT